MASTSGSRIQLDSSDRPSDHPGQSLVAEISNGEDFENWRRSIRIVLSAKQKIPFIDGSYSKPILGSPLLPH